jgi:inner membrane protein
MQLLTHALAGWCAGNAFSTNGRERLACMAISLFPDLDGLGLVISQGAYLRWHHVLAHNLFAGVLVSTLLMTLGRSELKIGVAYLLLFHLHLAMDLIGSGSGWGIAYLWPFSAHSLESSVVWDFRSWQNYAVFVALAALTVWIAFSHKRTPLECLAPRLDAALIKARR